MRGWIDLHCHWVVGIDDGAKTIAQSRQMLSALYGLGFSEVVATPHMRPGLFDTTQDTIRDAYRATRDQLSSQTSDNSSLPRLSLGAEHYFDDVVFQRILDGKGVPYPGGNAVLLEFYEISFPQHIDGLLAQLSRSGLTPVIAHPERYRSLWGKAQRLEQMLDCGARALLDTAALAGKYGRKPKQSAEEFLEADLYHAACSDAHKPQDVDAVARGISELQKRYGDTELERLFATGPQEILGR